MPRQLTFDLPGKVSAGRGDFFISPANAAAVAMLDGDWPNGRLLLSGPRGAGKSHLAKIWAGESGAHVVVATGLVAVVEEALEAQPLVIEDIDRIAGDRAGEEALFHVLNAQAQHGRALLLTSAWAVRAAGFVLPDLASRLQGMAVAALEAPDDALLSAVMVKLFADRQLAVPPDVIGYLATRIERSFEAARAAVEALDITALAEGRAVTRPLAAQVLDKLAGLDAD